MSKTGKRDAIETIASLESAIIRLEMENKAAGETIRDLEAELSSCRDRCHALNVSLKAEESGRKKIERSAAHLRRRFTRLIYFTAPYLILLFPITLPALLYGQHRKRQRAR